MNKQILSIFVLGVFFAKHVIIKFLQLFKKKPNQEELFKKNFINDNLTSFTKDEYDIIDKLSNCNMCGICSYENPQLIENEITYQIKPYEISTLLSRSQPDFIYIDNMVKYLYKYDWENINCPYDVPYKEGLNLIITLNKRLRKQKELYGIQ